MLDILRNRRSVRKFQDKPVEEEKIKLLTEALVRSPSSRSINPWEFILIDDRATLDRLSKCKPHGAGFLASAPFAVAILGDTSASDTCIEDCSIAAITLQYAAEALELGSCWCQVRLRSYSEELTAEQYVRNELGIPDHYLVEAIVGIGYPEKKPKGHPEDSLDWEKVHRNGFGNN